MKKTKTLLALFAIFLMTVSAHTGRVYEASEGFKAPQFTVHTDDGAVSLADMKGRYILLTFWNSTNPESRMTVNQFESLAGIAGDEKVDLLAVNLDENATLFEQIKRIDNLQRGTHVNPSQHEQAKIKSLYHLDGNLKSYLINPQGMIVAVNPTKQQLDKIVNEI